MTHMVKNVILDFYWIMDLLFFKMMLTKWYLFPLYLFIANQSLILMLIIRLENRFLYWSDIKIIKKYWK